MIKKAYNKRNFGPNILKNLFGLSNLMIVKGLSYNLINIDSLLMFFRSSRSSKSLYLCSFAGSGNS